MVPARYGDFWDEHRVAVAENFALVSLPLLEFVTLVFTIVAALMARDALITTHYDNIDEFYDKLLDEAMENPSLREPDRSYPYDERYNVYAYRVWNFLETIADRSKDDRIERAWGPVVATESVIHGEWFRKQYEPGEFKVRKTVVRKKAGTEEEERVETEIEVNKVKFDEDFRNWLVEAGVFSEREVGLPEPNKGKQPIRA